jgi:uncharacterized membrane protein
MKNKNLINYTIIIAWITAITLFLPNQENIIIQTLRLIFWSIFILFIPWYFLTLSFFDEKEIDFLERFALSFALSISVVPLLSFYLNLVWVKINELSVFLIVTWIILLNIIYLKFKKQWKKA